MKAEQNDVLVGRDGERCRRSLDPFLDLRGRMELRPLAEHPGSQGGQAGRFFGRSDCSPAEKIR